MDYEYKQCLNPILAELPLSKVYGLKYKYYNQHDKLKIIGNLKKLSSTMSNVALQELMKKESIIKLPCRKCINCMMKKAREWTVRNSLEAKSFEDSEKWFITLTYDKDNEKRSYHTHVKTLNKIDVQNFMKRLRSKFPGQNIRFFCCGEYGSKTLRPHYHLILYGLHLKNSDFEFLFSKDDYNYYRCAPIQEAWDMGITVTANFGEGEASYISQYTTKKLYKDPYVTQVYYGIVPEFINMSRRPGIAKDYYDKHKDEFYIKNNDTILFHTDYKTIHIKPFQFFDRYFDIDNSYLMNFFKENRKAYGMKYDFLTHYDFDKSISEWLDDNARKINNKKRRSREYGENNS